MRKCRVKLPVFLERYVPTSNNFDGFFVTLFLFDCGEEVVEFDWLDVARLEG